MAVFQKRVIPYSKFVVTFKLHTAYSMALLDTEMNLPGHFTGKMENPSLPNFAPALDNTPLSARLGILVYKLSHKVYLCGDTLLNTPHKVYLCRDIFLN